MPSEAKRKPITLPVYLNMIERGVLGKRDKVELINGEIIEMSPISYNHSYAVGELHELLILRLEGKAKVWSQSSVRMNDLSVPEPDLAILKKERNKKQYPGPEDILLLIEVADSSLTYNREVKMPLYASAGIPEFWLVNLKNESFETYCNPSGNQYLEKQVFGRGETAIFHAFNTSIPVSGVLGD